MTSVYTSIQHNEAPVAQLILECFRNRRMIRVRFRLHQRQSSKNTVLVFTLPGETTASAIRNVECIRLLVRRHIEHRSDGWGLHRNARRAFLLACQTDAGASARAGRG